MFIRDIGRFRDAFTASGLSRREVARRAGWGSHSYFQRLLRGEAEFVSDDAAVKIAEALNVAVDEIFAPNQSRNQRRDNQK